VRPFIRNADVESAESFANFAYKTCTNGKVLNHDPDLSSCEAERAKNLKTWMDGDRGNVLFAALAPIPVFWLTDFILLHVGRAQVIGFRAAVPWGTLSRPRKAFVVFCVLTSLAALLFGIIVVLNLSVARRVPNRP
jgi:hypothetical protein